MKFFKCKTLRVKLKNMIFYISKIFVIFETPVK